MGHIKEPPGIDFFVENKQVSEEDKKQISEIIAYYKATGRKKNAAKKVKTTTQKIKHPA